MAEPKDPFEEMITDLDLPESVKPPYEPMMDPDFPISPGAKLSKHAPESRYQRQHFGGPLPEGVSGVVYQAVLKANVENISQLTRIQSAAAYLFVQDQELHEAEMALRRQMHQRDPIKGYDDLIQKEGQLKQARERLSGEQQKWLPRVDAARKPFEQKIKDHIADMPDVAEEAKEATYKRIMAMVRSNALAIAENAVNKKKPDQGRRHCQ
ncbi:MAG: hypothetical protein SFT92_02115 [Rickettsiales bacterium]|nr:hypothetical protein [Rickettsiales bacterium]